MSLLVMTACQVRTLGRVILAAAVGYPKAQNEVTIPSTTLRKGEGARGADQKARVPSKATILLMTVYQSMILAVTVAITAILI